ncbi:hypothetical protein OSB04_031211 [Centaurea solstitialis]|uniref:Pectinesterase inhibitor domain-containing protein n=1 Tax=Centaurea solstitialis TaxID=347529 RepID=A0AA38SU93_9ASTR|nr:hypothetical protein OSB04_031211 [Centaurea solstitialis]
MAFARKTISFIFIFIHIIFAPSFAAKARSISSYTIKARSTISSTARPDVTKNKGLPLSPSKAPVRIPDYNSDQGRKLGGTPGDAASVVTKKMEEIKTMVTEFSASLKKRNANPDPGIKKCFSECDEVMLSALDDIEKALNSVKSQDFAKANFDISAVMTNVDTCGDCFVESGGEDAETKKLITQVQKLTGEALDALQANQPPG